MGVDTRSDTQKNFLGNSGIRGGFLQGVQLIDAVHYEISNAGFHRQTDFLVGFVVTVEICPFHRETGAVGGKDFSGGHHIHADAL